MTTDPDPRAAQLARLRSLEVVLAMWDKAIRDHQASMGHCLGQRDRAQAELAVARQEVARVWREGVQGT